ncbi:MAG: amino acid permease [Methylobacter sp.]|nr:amino acid permease [Methylobacter sp.]
MNASKSQSLGVFSLWAIGVGLVISGESFGWNIGWGIIGAKSFFVPVLIAATLYFCLVKNLIELTCVYPNSEGPQAFAELAYGKIVGNFISIVLLVEFLFAIPAVANAISEYLGFLVGSHHFDLWIATAFLLVFCIINYFHISLKIKFVIILTILAILELNIFSLSILPKFSLQNFMVGRNENLSAQTILLALPYAVWMFLAIEGLALFTKYVDYNEFREKISAGYIYSILTLFIFCSVILMLAGGGIIWNEEVWNFITSNNHPMPAILATVLGQDSIITRVFTFLGLFGLIASFQGVVSVAIIQFENIISDYITDTSTKRILSTLLVLIVGLVSVWSSTTGMLIEFSVFAAVSLYFCVGLSLYKLRTDKVDINNKISNFNYRHSDFSDIQSNIYVFISCLISLICVFAFSYSQTKSFFIFSALSISYFVYSFYFKKLKV